MEGWCWPQKHWTHKDKRWLRNFTASWRSRILFWEGMLIFLAIVAFIALAMIFGWLFWFLIGIFAVFTIIGVIDITKKEEMLDEVEKRAQAREAAIKELHKARYAAYMKKFNRASKS